ncbi:MAG: hypothetical protein KC419_11560 [Anaerolineales bacterium]|nr:hypothetical protein [Anaerolineales bacterium]MCA9929112.1 hypothetical protein [Anaerolineales bacterium]
MKQKQHRAAHGCLQVLAAFVVVIFVLTAVPITLIVTLTNTITNRENIKSIVSVDGFVREFMVQGIEADIRQSYVEMNLPFPGVDRRGIENAVDLVVPADWVDNALGASIDNIYNFLEDGRTDDYVLDVAPLINGLQSESGREAMTIIVSQYPPCQTAEMPPIIYVEQNVEITCIPAGIPVNQFAGQIHSALAEGLTNDPELQPNGGVEPLKWSGMDPLVVEDILAAYDIIDSVWLA